MEQMLVESIAATATAITNTNFSLSFTSGTNDVGDVAAATFNAIL